MQSNLTMGSTARGGLTVIAGGGIRDLLLSVRTRGRGRYLGVLHLPGRGELTIFLRRVDGRSGSDPLFNAIPAQVFMGDTGALGDRRRARDLAILLKTEFLLLIRRGRVRRGNASRADPDDRV